MVLYPLNALVEDQLRRLRATLDGPENWDWMDGNRGGNRILFGRYTGLTPVSGSNADKGAIERLAKHLRQVEKEFAKAIQAADKGNEDLRYHFQNPWGGEMWSRWDMQETPPDLMITNYSMLNIMLMRDIERPVFEKTRAWLASDKQNTFSLVVNELHWSRGTPGTEVAYILRIFLDRIGLSPESDQLRILSTSASIQSDSLQFLEEFFGRDKDRFVVIDSPQTIVKKGAIAEVSAKASLFEAFAQGAQASPTGSMQPPRDDDVNLAAVQLCCALGKEPPEPGKASEALGDALLGLGVPEAVREACIVANGSLRASRLDQLDQIIFPDAPRKTGKDISDAMRGLLLAPAHPNPRDRRYCLPAATCSSTTSRTYGHAQMMTAASFRKPSGEDPTYSGSCMAITASIVGAGKSPRPLGLFGVRGSHAWRLPLGREHQRREFRDADLGCAGHRAPP